MTNIVIARDFSKTPFGRYISDSPNSAERFRREFLVPALKNGTEQLVVDFRGAMGVGSSFLEEAFGGLVRREGVAKSDLRKRLIIQSDMPYYKELIERFIDQATPS